MEDSREGGVPRYTRAHEVQVARASPGRGRSVYAAASGVLLVLTVGVVLLARSSDQSQGMPPSARAVSEAAASLSTGPSSLVRQGLSADAAWEAKEGLLDVSTRQAFKPALHPLQALDTNVFSNDGPAVNDVFTGHTHGSKGDPMSFGPNTYWNVFDPNGAPGLGPCGPGQFGQAGTATQKRDCSACPAAKWCPGATAEAAQEAVVNDCPDKSTSQPGSKAADQCTCIQGWYGIAHYHETKSCKMCLADTWCPGGRYQHACPEHSSSPDEQFYCTCDPGYWGATHNDCTLCSADHYCVGGDPGGYTQIQCPPHSNSPEGSDDGTDCQCNAGFYEPVASADPRSGPKCTGCPANTYCPGGATNANCMANSASDPLSKAATDCKCVAGYYGNSEDGCTLCPSGSYCPGGLTSFSCPAHSNSPAASSSVSDCTCNAGWSGSDPTACAACSAGMYCPGHGAIYPCGPNSNSNAGSSSCSCNSAFTKINGFCWPVVARLTATSSTTGQTSIGAGNVHYLDRQHVNCGSQPMSQFRFTDSGNGAMAYELQCDSGAKWLPPVGHYSSWQEDGNGNTAFLDRQNVECPAGTAIASFNLQRNGDGNRIRYYMTCVQPKVTTQNFSCRDISTAYADSGGYGERTMYLDRLNTKCGTNEVLQQFKIQTSGNNWRYKYRCCSVDGRNDAAAIAQYDTYVFPPA